MSNIMIPVTQGSDNFKPRTLLYGDRYRELDFREAYYNCTQHDVKGYDFDGRVVGKGPRSGNVQPLISEMKSPIYVPLNMRRPSAPVRLGKIIVDSYTSLIFGENRFPSVRVEGDDDADDFVQTLARAARLPLVAIRLRTLGGSMGSVGLSWCFYKGSPRFEVHSPKNLFVHSWYDRALLLPKHVTEVYLFYKQVWDGKGFNKHYFWYRRDWTPDGDFVFKEVLYEKGKDPTWEIDEEKSAQHNDGVVHFEWIQNLPTDEIDGLPDYDGLYDQFDQIDILNSVVTRGAILNLDPTLKLKVDPDIVARLGVRKGSDNALILGTDGDAEYMELNGTSIEAGVKLLDNLRRNVLETAQCIVPNPNEVAAQGISSVAIKAMFAPMTSKAEVYREQYGAAIRRALQNMVDVARTRMNTPTTVDVMDDLGNPMVGPDGQPVQQQEQAVLTLPPRIEKIPQKTLDPVSGLPVDAVDPISGEPIVVPTPFPRTPGNGGEVSLVWPPFFSPTFDDQNKVAMSMQVATGGKGFLSVKSATDVYTQALGLDPAEEQKRMELEHTQNQANQAAMFPPAGGPTEGTPPAAPAAPHEGGPGAPFANLPEEKPDFTPDEP